MVLLQTASFDSSFQMAEFTTALINGKNTACKSVLIDLAEAERREQKNNEKPKSRTKQQPNKSKNKQHKNNPSSPSISGLTADPWMIMDVWQLCSTDLNQENKKALDFIPFIVSARACGGTFVAMGQRGQSSMHHGIPNCPCASMRSAVGLCSHWLSECLEFASSLLTDVSQFDFKLTIKPHHQEQ
jgi:hypothetical protein